MALKRATQLLREFSLPLIAGVVVALIWANVDEPSHDALLHTPLGADFLTFHFVVNELFMALFFGIATKEIAEACFPGGALNPIKKALNPLIATLGGVFGPIAVYVAIVAATGDTAIMRGWGIPTATDIALAWLVARMVFGAGHPAVSFLLLLAIADDGIGLAIIAIFYPDPLHPVQPLFLGLVLIGILIAIMLRRRKVLSFWPYLLIAGAFSWAGLYFAHLHPALALVPIVPFMPRAGKDEGFFVEEDHEAGDTMGDFEHAMKPIVDFGLFGFGLANAGVSFAATGTATWAVVAALGIGKTLGVFLFGMAAVALGFPLPTGMGKRELFVAGMNAALGLTVALFVAGVAFTDPDLQGMAKMGALLSAVFAPVIIVGARLLGIRPMGAK